MDTAGHFATLYRFPADQSAITWPFVEGPDGAIYGLLGHFGTTEQATLFKITPAGELTRLHSFVTGHESDYPRSGLMRASDGKLYGIVGKLFRFDPETNEVTVVGAASADSQGLVEGPDGAFYWSNLFQVAGSFELRRAFYRSSSTGGGLVYAEGEADGSSGCSGGYPLQQEIAPLIVGTDGALYGTVCLGPARRDASGPLPGGLGGGVFRLNPLPLS